MLTKGNIGLQRRRLRADLPFMRHAASARQVATSTQALSLGQLAHELNSLLDGSLRSVALAQRSLDEAASDQASVVGPAVHRLGAAQRAMAQMAALLGRVMAESDSSPRILDQDRQVASQVHAALESVAPFAHEHQVAIEVEMTPAASCLPGRSLGHLILNGLRNAIQACAAVNGQARHVALSIAVGEDRHLVILIADNGPGMPLIGPPISGWRRQGGHGHGLEICQRILEELDGELRFINVPFSQGAVMQVRVPLRSLCGHE